MKFINMEKNLFKNKKFKFNWKNKLYKKNRNKKKIKVLYYNL